MDNIEGIQARSKCDWHEYEQKSFKFFWGLNKHRGTQGRIQKRISRNVENIGKTEITKEINKIYQKLYERNIIKESNLIHKYNFVKRK